jgi:hypothetical protein
MPAEGEAHADGGVALAIQFRFLQFSFHKKGMSRRRKKKKSRRGGGEPFGEQGLVLRRVIEELLGAIEVIGASGTRGRRAARENISGVMFEVVERVSALAFEKKGGVVAQWAVEVLSVLVDRCIGVLLRLGVSEVEGRGKERAGSVLARVETALEKHMKKLERVNKGYVETKARIKEHESRRDVVCDPKVIGRIVQRELAAAELYRGVLRYYRRLGLLGPNRTLLVRSEVPRKYWETLELAELSVKSEPEWWAFLWPVIKGNNQEFLVGVLEGRFPTLGRRLHTRWSSYREEFRSHLQSLAAARDKAAG